MAWISEGCGRVSTPDSLEFCGGLVPASQLVLRMGCRNAHVRQLSRTAVRRGAPVRASPRRYDRARAHGTGSDGGIRPRALWPPAPADRTARHRDGIRWTRVVGSRHGALATFG